MCGIAGSVSLGSARTLDRALDLMVHRGPDAGEAEAYEIAGRAVRLGHRRLSIIDLSDAANQPIDSGDGQYTIVYNGEIYNFVTLRNEYAARGYAFRTHSDTEVILAGYALDGQDFVSRLNGMFVFAILDRANGRLFFARDSVGIKPLYYRASAEGFAFASEIRGLEAIVGEALRPDPASFGEFLLNGFLYEPSTGFVGVQKIPPGHVLSLDIGSLDFELTPYVANPQDEQSDSGSFDSALRNQVAMEMHADVPVGIFFSGGLDSSVIAAAAPREAEAFFVDYGADSEGDRHYARAVAEALGIQFRQTTLAIGELGSEAILDEFRQVARGTEEPISDYTFIATRILSRLAREAGYKVMLSGMGGDELFAGYPRQRAASLWPLLRLGGKPAVLASRLLRRIRSWSKRADRLEAFLAAPDFATAYTSLVGYFSAAEVTRMLGSQAGVDQALGRLRALLGPVSGESALRQAMHLDRSGFLAHNLTVTDRASMLESVEVRVPLLAPQMQRIAHTTADRDLLSGGRGKIPLRGFLKGRLPYNLIERPKIGFNPPLDRRIARLGRALCEELLTTGPIAGVVDPVFAQTLVRDHFDKRANNTYRIWQLVYFRLWLEEHADKAAPAVAFDSA